MAIWEHFTNQKQWEVYLKELVKTNDKALLKSIVLMYDNKDESVEDSCIGFSKIDANEMSDITRKIKAGKALTKDELAKSRNKMQKYWKQLMIISKKQAEAKKLQEQKKLENKLKFEQFSEHSEIIRRCYEEGIACEYGICSECPVSQGLQTR